MAVANETIEVLYALMDKSGTYSKFAGTSICSMFENTKEKVRVHIFHDGSIKGENEKNFKHLADAYGQKVILCNVRKQLPEVWAEAEEIKEEAITDARYTEATLYRLLAPQILPQSVTRLIYIDADTIVNIDIKRLWQEKIGPNGMSAVFERDILAHYDKVPTGLKKEMEELKDYFADYGVKMDEFFNAGILLMDLSKMRTMDNLLLSGLRLLAKSGSENNFYDQNILNFYFAEKAFHLPWQYNILQHLDRDIVKEPRNIEGIYHYMGRTLGMDGEEPRDTIFYEYFIKTPWMEGKTVCNFFMKLGNIYLRYMEKRFAIMRQLISELAGKKLVLASSLNNEEKVWRLLLEPGNFVFKATYGKDIKEPDFLKNNEASRNDENESKGESYIERKKFPANVRYCYLGPDKKMSVNLQYDVDEYFYLFFVDDYIALKMRLERAGLPEKEHYMDGTIFIEETIEGGVINPNKFIEKL